METFWIGFTTGFVTPFALYALTLLAAFVYVAFLAIMSIWKD